jgi:hypothetical protein
MNNNSYIYFVIEREFLKSQENVIKLGRTKNLERRMKQYPKGSAMLAAAFVTDAKEAEGALQCAFRAAFTRRKDIGNEYYEGHPHTMLMVFHNVASKYMPHSANAVDTLDDEDVEDTPDTGTLKPTIEYDVDILVHRFITKRLPTLAAREVNVLDIFDSFKRDLPSAIQQVSMERFVSSVKNQFGFSLCNGNASGATIVFPVENTLRTFIDMTPDERNGWVIEMREGDMTPLDVFKNAFQDTMMAAYKPDPATFRTFGFHVPEKQVNVCKSCKGISRGGLSPCCASYSPSNRSRRKVIMNMFMEIQNGPRPSRA